VAGSTSAAEIRTLSVPRVSVACITTSAFSSRATCASDFGGPIAPIAGAPAPAIAGAMVGAGIPPWSRPAMLPIAGSGIALPAPA